MVEVRLARFVLSGLQLVFTVPLPNGDVVFMKQQTLPGDRERYAIVCVESERFLELWRRDDFQREFANGSPETWRHDGKYGRAAEGFSFGPTNPVPLAYANFRVYRRQVISRKLPRIGRDVSTEDVGVVSLTNGITRTIWLLSQRCRAFPVKCDIDEAHHLYRAAGMTDTTVHNIDELAESLTKPNPDAFDDAND